VAEVKRIAKRSGSKRKLNGAPRVREKDFMAWLLDQAATLRLRRHQAIDGDDLAEELEAMARSEEHGLESYLEVLLGHLLKWADQPERRSGSWEASIENSRDQVAARVQRSPSLKAKLEDLAASAYRRARRTAGAEMGLDREQWNRLVPQSCEWSVELVVDSEFWPSAATLDRNQ
jgi:hypothetical protein